MYNAHSAGSPRWGIATPLLLIACNFGKDGINDTGGPTSSPDCSSSFNASSWPSSPLFNPNVQISESRANFSCQSGPPWMEEIDVNTDSFGIEEMVVFEE